MTKLPTYSNINFFIFLSNFQISKHFICLLSGTERPTKLKLGPHMDSRWMYHVYLNQAAGAYLFLYIYNFFSLKFQNIKFLSHFSVRPAKLKLDTHIDIRLICCVHQIQAARIYLFLHIQATPAVSISCILILLLNMSKWFFIPNFFSLYFFAFQLSLCPKQLTWSNGYLEVIFHALDIFSVILAIVYVEVNIGAVQAPYCLLRLCTCISWGANIFQTTIKIN